MGVSVMIYDSHLLPVKTLLYPLFIHVALVDVTCHTDICHTCICKHKLHDVLQVYYLL